MEAICLRALEKNPASRYESTGALAADLRRYLAGELHLGCDHFPSCSVWRPLGRVARPVHAALVLVTLASLVTIVAGTIAYTVRLNGALLTAEQNFRRAEHGEELAQQEGERANAQLYPGALELTGSRA